MPPIDWVTAIQAGGFATLSIAVIWGLATGFARVGKLVDAATKELVAAYDKTIAELKADFVARDALRDRREAELIREMTEWKSRSIANDQRLEQLGARLELAYTILTGTVSAAGKELAEKKGP